MKLSHHYHDLGSAFARPVMPAQAPEPELLLWNQSLADELGINTPTDARTGLFSGTTLPTGTKPVAMAYSGHQFGQFNPQLGDGRAHLLGEHRAPDGQLYDVHLKGSGRTPFSRNGDGKCAIKPAVREYLMSEAMHALGIPTCRTLAVVTTGETVFREQAVPGAVVTRIAESHIRVGSFEHFAARKHLPELARLTDLCVARHGFDVPAEGPERYLSFYSQVIDKQIYLLVHWMRVGFIHGVMNTDNCLLSGHTIDYGPCAMLGTYDPHTVYSSIDHQGRYAFGNQPAIMQWNMARLAECLLPLIADDQQRAIDQVMPVIEDFSVRFNQKYRSMLAGKLGFTDTDQEVSTCVDELLKRMQQQQLDHTLTFAALTNSLSEPVELPGLSDWMSGWQQLRQQRGITPTESEDLMKSANPLVIPRNHHVERVLRQVEATSDVTELHRFLNVLATPYDLSEHIGEYQDAPTDGDDTYQTFCGT